MPPSDSKAWSKKKKKKKILEKLCTVFTITTKIIHLELGVAILMEMKRVSTLMPYFECWRGYFLWLWSKGGMAACWALWPQLPLVCFQLRGSQVLNGWAGHTKLGKIAASLISDTIYKQQVITCFTFYLSGSFLAKAGPKHPHRGQLSLQSTQ